MKRRGYLVTTIKALRAELAKSRSTRVFYAYKYAKANGRSPVRPGYKPILTTKVGRVLHVPKPNLNKYLACGAGVNVATKRWCIKDAGRYTFHPTKGGYEKAPSASELMSYWNPDKVCPAQHKLFLVRFTKADVACVPRHTGGKFRLYRCTVVEEVKVAPPRNDEL